MRTSLTALTAWILVAAFAMAAGCGEDPSTPPFPTQDGSGSCGPGNCQGCCLGGLCIAPPTTTACGGAGFPCVACNTGQSCINGVCLGGTSCDPTNCSGCCKSGQCLGGLANATCGTGGIECVDCAQNGGTCVSGACKTGSGCDSTTCSGCCNGTNCIKNPGDTYCGKSGAKCVDCTTNGDICDASAGTCKTSSTTCNSSNCKGCCSGNTCVTSLTDAKCGISGGNCIDCSSSSKTCNTSTGVCEGGTGTCTPSNCTGCCSGTTCVTSPTNTQCGKGGIGCLNCALQGQTCDATSGSCQSRSSCGPSNCTGCCQGNQCKPGTSAAECGLNGAPCFSCPHPSLVCTQGSCVMSPTAKWELVATSAVINTLKTWDGWPSNPAPDGYLGVKFSSSCSQYSLDKCSSSHDNTYNPVWNESMGTYDASKLTAPWCAFVGDSDSVTTCLPPFETIGMCQLSVTEMDLIKGSKVVYSCPNPDGKNYVTYLQVNFTYKP